VVAAHAVTSAGQYRGADLAYDQLLGKLSDHKFAGTSAPLRSNILDYYKDRMPPVSPPAAKASKEWAKLVEERAELEQIQPEASAPVTNSYQPQ
jgi:hypothetical protein